MNVPTPIENLPGFDSGGSTQSGLNPWLKFIIVGGIILVSVVISSSVIKRVQQNRIIIKSKENGND